MTFNPFLGSSTPSKWTDYFVRKMPPRLTALQSYSGIFSLSTRNMLSLLRGVIQMLLSRSLEFLDYPMMPLEFLDYPIMPLEFKIDFFYSICTVPDISSISLYS